MKDYDIRDADLLAKLKEHEGNFGFENMARMLEHSQKKRDEEAAKKAAKEEELSKLPPSKRRRAVIREVIESEGASPDNLRFMPTPLAICGLPYRALPNDVRQFERRQGRMAVYVEAGGLRAPDGTRVAQPLPYGPKARLIIAHLATGALKNKSPVIETADTLTKFMRDMGYDVTGGARGTIKPFKDQLRALAACRMELSSWDGRKSAQLDVKPFNKMELWFGDNPDQMSLWPNTVAFSDEFYDSLTKHALPVDVRALKALANSARKLDLLFWISYRMTRLESKLVLDWKPLKEQFGEGFSRERAFRAKFAEDVDAILELFPKVPLKLTERGLELHGADPDVLAIPRRARRK